MRGLQPLRALKRVQTPQWGNMSSANRIINNITKDSKSKNFFSSKNKERECSNCGQPFMLEPNRNAKFGKRDDLCEDCYTDWYFKQAEKTLPGFN